MTSKFFVPVVFFMIIITPAIAQNVSKNNLNFKRMFEADAAIAGGHENNIFKSTSRYFDRTLNDYLPKDSLIKSDRFYDASLDAGLVLKRKKSTIDFRTANWYRGYFNNNNLNQLKSNFKALYGCDFTEKTYAGILYQATYSNKIGVTTTGDEITRSFKYFENSGSVFVEHNFNDNNQVTLNYTIAYQKYLKEQLDYSLTNIESGINLLYKRKIYKHLLYTSISRANRKYLEYQALDKNGKLLTQNPLRNFKYTDIGLKFRYFISETFMAIPAIDYSIRKDMFEDYYSYKKFAIGSSIKYSNKKLKATAGIDYKQILYDIKQAPSLTNSNRLKYKYINTSLNVSYILNKKFNAFVNFESNSRGSNTELEYYRTLRPYNWYEILLGIKYEFN